MSVPAQLLMISPLLFSYKGCGGRLYVSSPINLSDSCSTAAEIHMRLFKYTLMFKFWGRLGFFLSIKCFSYSHQTYIYLMINSKNSNI